MTYFYSDLSPVSPIIRFSSNRNKRSIDIEPGTNSTILVMSYFFSSLRTFMRFIQRLGWFAWYPDVSTVSSHPSCFTQMIFTQQSYCFRTMSAPVLEKGSCKTFVLILSICQFIQFSTGLGSFTFC